MKPCKFSTSRHETPMTDTLRGQAKKHASGTARMSRIADCRAEAYVLGYFEYHLVKVASETRKLDCSLAKGFPVIVAARKSRRVDINAPLRSVKNISEEEDFDSIENMVVVLPCSHLLTVESADGIAGLNQFYAQNARGEWTHPTAPSESMPAPRCPTCRHPFYLNRYSRVFKKADIDMSEKSLAGYSTHAMADIQKRFEDYKEVKFEASAYKSEPSKYHESKYRKCELNVQSKLAEAFAKKRLVDTGMIGNIQKTFGLTPSHSKLWEQKVGPSLVLVRQIDSILKRPSPQQVAWDAAFAKLFRAELAGGRCRPEGAQMLARRSLGTPRPVAKQQYAIQAICLSVQVRHRLASIAEEFSNASSCVEEKRHWDLLASSFLHSTVIDCEVGRNDAMDAILDPSYYTVSYYHFQSTFLLFRHSMSKKVRSRLSIEDRQNMLSTSNDVLEQAAATARQAPRGEVTAFEIETPVEFQETVVQPMQKIIDDWHKLSDSLLEADFIQPVTDDERLSILKSFGFASRGHFFTCPNGHPYIITECGGAMQRSKCPECGAAIGGANHALESGNRQDETMEGLAERVGMAPSPWRFN
ncbi:hypothetical protein QFC22_005181 [Naganishia vaughanmartiniae]|uniref:Uncharacterized protein n=1 Tax=Naganishia vaughanmartiniae TaxID=1424756 RepID=A0ACC2WWB4_9TREE|nr:hypothetical protein QFC22_005181 [Naganishia vaughanmartiniae]